VGQELSRKLRGTEAFTEAFGTAQATLDLYKRPVRQAASEIASKKDAFD
jgi:hypothetical protein